VFTAREVAIRLGTAVSTLNAWLADDEMRAQSHRLFEFHRWRGNKRMWTEEGFERLEMAIHSESQCGVLAGGRTREKNGRASPPDPDAEVALETVLGTQHVRTY
jgi:hypothetical protein